MPNQKSGQRVNDAIRARRCVLIGKDGTNMGTVSTRDAIEIARADDLDLVSVGGSDTLPVCRVMNYSKYKYEQEKKEKRNRRNTKEIKQMKFRVSIGDGDLEHKVANVNRFLDDGHKVVLTVMYRGRELSHTELGIELLNRVSEMVLEHGHVISAPKVVGRDATMTVAPNKATK